ncbi:MAG: proline dehydrogenase family protein, partial [Burkholderiaceae bacterium]|nr:proline dehydrogenase family protein [Burkholderiaceae bacterium]
MGEPLYDAARRAQRLTVPVRVYAPVGAFDALLPYLVRRLLENGANSSFLAQLGDGDPHAPAAAAADHRALFAAGPGAAAIVLPRALFGERANSAGVDFGRSADTAALLKHGRSTPSTIEGLVDFYANRPASQANHGDNASLSIVNPATGQTLAALPLPATAALDAACARAQAAQPRWQAQGAAGRAARIAAWGDALERNL